MNTSSVYIFSVILILLVMMNVVFWLFQKKHNRVIKKEIDHLYGMIENSHNDVSGLCTAAHGVDERAAGCEKNIRELLSRLDELEDVSSQGHLQAFQGATVLAKDGASTKEIVEKFNLTFDEADLLIRLYKN